MQKITATEFARNLRKVIDRVCETGEEFVVERGRRPVVKVSAVPERQTAQEVLGDLFRVLPDGFGDDWLRDARHGSEGLKDDVRDPWAS